MNVEGRSRAAQVTIAAVALGVGTVAVLRTGHVGFDSRRSVPLIDSRLVDGALLTFNRAGALVVLVLGIVALAGALARWRSLVLVVVGGFTLVVVQVLAQYGRAVNLLGTNGSNLSFALAAAVGLATLSLCSTRRSARPGR
ncbi:MAG: Rv1678 family membrane protein [Acidimicrobiales bacterium]